MKVESCRFIRLLLKHLIIDAPSDVIVRIHYVNSIVNKFVAQLHF